MPKSIQTRLVITTSFLSIPSLLELYKLAMVAIDKNYLMMTNLVCMLFGASSLHPFQFFVIVFLLVCWPFIGWEAAVTFFHNTVYFWPVRHFNLQLLAGRGWCTVND